MRVHTSLDTPSTRPRPTGWVGVSGAYGGKAGFDEFTHRRTLSAQTGTHGLTDG